MKKDHFYIEDTLVGAKLNRTNTRQQLLSLFELDRAWSARQLSDLLHADTSTIYRNLKQFEKANLITSVFERSGEALYERAGRTHHDHAVCESCATPRCVPCPVSTSKPHLLQLFETCSSCKSS